MTSLVSAGHTKTRLRKPQRSVIRQLDAPPNVVAWMVLRDTREKSRVAKCQVAVKGGPKRWKKAKLRLLVSSFQQREIHAEERFVIPGSMPKPGWECSRYHKINIPMSQSGNGAVPQKTRFTGKGARWSVMQNREYLPCSRVHQEQNDKRVRSSPSQFHRQNVRRRSQSAREMTQEDSAWCVQKW